MKGRTFKIKVKYGGTQKKAPKYTRPRGTQPPHFMATPQIGVAQVPPKWDPANNRPAGRATFDIKLGVKKGSQAISVGKPISKKNKGKRTIWHWKPAVPMDSAYAVWGSFDLVQGISEGRPYIYAFQKGIPKKIRVSSEKAPKEDTGCARSL